jgi:hypothetical protein
MQKFLTHFQFPFEYVPSLFELLPQQEVAATQIPTDE